AQDTAADARALPAGAVPEAARPFHGRLTGARRSVAHFYIDERLEAAEVGARVTVSGGEARHAVTVGRLRVGETISVGNGRGLVVTGTVTSAEPTEFALTATGVDVHDLPEPQLWLAQALAKNDRDELAIQMAT